MESSVPSQWSCLFPVQCQELLEEDSRGDKEVGQRIFKSLEPCSSLALPQQLRRAARNLVVGMAQGFCLGPVRANI